MEFEVIYSEEVQMKIEKFEKILEQYEKDLRVNIQNRYGFYEDWAAIAHIREKFNNDVTRITIKWHIQNIKNLSIPEDIRYKF